MKAVEELKHMAIIYIGVEVAIGKNLYKHFKNVHLLGSPIAKIIQKDCANINKCYIMFI